MKFVVELSMRDVARLTAALAYYDRHGERSSHNIGLQERLNLIMENGADALEAAESSPPYGEIACTPIDDDEKEKNDE